MISVLISSFLFNVGCYRVEIKGARKMDVFINLICIGRIDIVMFLGIWGGVSVCYKLRLTGTCLFIQRC